MAVTVTTTINPRIPSAANDDARGRAPGVSLSGRGGTAAVP